MTGSRGNFIWYELLTSDLDAACTFYGNVVGWSVQTSSAPGVDYRELSIGGTYVGGMMALPPGAAQSGMGPTWLGYINVADVDGSVEAITRAGGRTHMPPTEIADIGRFALIADPQGALIYVMTPKGEGESTAFAAIKPGHCGWNELHTTDGRAALAFYGEQFGWTKSGEMDMGPMGTYTMFATGADAIGGMMDNPQARPSWLYYINVDSIDAAKLRVEKSGGAVQNGPQQVPGGSWIIQCSDPQGASFALVGPRSDGG